LGRFLGSDSRHQSNPGRDAGQREEKIMMNADVDVLAALAQTTRDLVDLQDRVNRMQTDIDSLRGLVEAQQRILQLVARSPAEVSGQHP
jgi:TolA-binding protein